MQNKSVVKNLLQGIQLRLGKIFHNPYSIVNINPIQKIIYKHLVAGKLRSHRLFGKEIFFVSPTELLHGLHEIFIEEVYKQNLPAKPYIIDCGANIGLSVIYMKYFHPDAEILAFEPDEENFRLLEKNIQAFGFKDIEPRREAVWVKKEMLSFAGKGSTESKLVDDGLKGAVIVNAIRLKDQINKKVDFLKIDIEGAEYKVIADIQEKLHFVQNLFLEYHGDFDQNQELTELLVIIGKSGFSYYIKEAAPVYSTPFSKPVKNTYPYDLQLNIFCFRVSKKQTI